MTTKGEKKEHIKVFVLTGPETSGIVAHEIKQNGKIETEDTPTCTLA